MVNWIWFITTAVSLFLAGTTGIIASAFGVGEKSTITTQDGTEIRKSKRPSWSHVILAIALFAMLVTMIAGVMILANYITVNTPLGSKHLPPAVIYVLIVVAVAGMMLVAGWIVRMDEVTWDIFSWCK